MNNKMRKVTLLVGTLLLVSSAFGQGKGKGQQQREGAAARPGGGVSVSVVFSEQDKRLIGQWVKGINPGGLPPGLAKRGELPPGLQKQLRKNGTLPPGLEKRISPFPGALAARLAPLPAGCDCDRIFLDGKAMIVVRGTRIILDVMSVF